MFTIEKSDSIGPMGDDKTIIDRARNVWARRVTGLGLGTGHVFKLVWEHRVIPFAATIQGEPLDDATRAQLVADGAPPEVIAKQTEKLTYRILGVGRSDIGERIGGPPPCAF